MINVANNKSPHLVAVNLTLLRVVDVLVNMFFAAKDVLETFVRSWRNKKLETSQTSAFLKIEIYGATVQATILSGADKALSECSEKIKKR